MNKKIVLILPIALLVLVTLVFLNRPKNQLSNPLPIQTKKVIPSETFLEYSDPSGFTFSYPDNLSITKNEIEDTSTYVDIQLSSKDVNGSLNLKIADTKFASIDEWVKINKTASEVDPKEVKLGNLKALEVKLTDRLLLGALDQGVLFTIEMPLIEEDFWMTVYDTLLADFSFVPPSPGQVSSSANDVIFEGEEVVE